MKNKLLYSLLAAALVVQSCSKENVQPNQPSAKIAQNAEKTVKLPGVTVVGESPSTVIFIPEYNSPPGGGGSGSGSGTGSGTGGGGSSEGPATPTGYYYTSAQVEDADGIGNYNKILRIGMTPIANSVEALIEIDTNEHKILKISSTFVGLVPGQKFESVGDGTLISYNPNLDVYIFEFHYKIVTTSPQTGDVISTGIRTIRGYLSPRTGKGGLRHMD